jgi:hypothetical protein
MSDKEQRIRVRAYHIWIWECEGCRDGRAEDHWLEAEIEVERELTQPAAQFIDLQEQPKKKADKHRKAPAGRAIEARAKAPEKVKSKSVASRSKTPSDTARLAEMG